MTMTYKELQDQLQLTEANLLDSYSRLVESISAYSDYIHIMEFTPSNSDAVNNFIHGIESLSAAFRSTIEVTRLIAEMKNIKLTD